MSLSDQLWCPTSVQVTVLQARGLRIKGKSGTNDAYAVMQVAKEKYQTSVAEKSVAPVWKEEATFDLPQGAGGGGGGGSTDRSTLHVHVLHRALVGPDKLLGQAVINLLQLSEDKTRNKSEWFKLLDKTGKADKDRGEVFVDIQFMRNNMTASMFDLSGAGKSRSRLGKFKDKVRGKKKESDTASTIVQPLTQVLTDSEEEGNDDVEVAAGKEEKKKKKKIKSLFSTKSNLQRNMSQSMTVLPAKNSTLSGSQSSGLNVDSSEGKKKFKFMMHKRSGSSDSKDSSSVHQKHGAAEQSNLCINGSHIYCEEPQSRTSRIGSNFSLASSGHGSMEDVPESSPPSVDSLRAVRQYSPWTEEEEETAEVESIKEDVSELREEEERIRMDEENRRKEEEMVRRREEEEAARLAEEKRRLEEEQRRQREEEERAQEERRRQEEERKLAEEKRRLEEEERRIEEEKIRKEEEERIRREEEERRRREEEERAKREEEERERLAEEKRRLQEQERRRIEEEEKRQREEEERIRMEEERAQEQRRRQEEEERARRQEEERKLEEEKRRLEEERRIEEENTRKEEEERIRREEERRRQEEEEMMRRQEEHEEMRRLEEQERRQREEEERIKQEEEKARREKEEYEALLEEKRKLEEEERKRIEAEEKIRKEEEARIRVEEEQRRKEEEERVKREEEEELKRLAEEKMKLEEQERRRIEEERQREEMIRKEEERRKEEEERARKEKEEYERLVEEKMRQEEQERRRLEEEERIRKEEQERIRMEEEKRRREEEEKRIIEEEEKIKREEEERIRKEEEARKLEEVKRDAEEQKKRENQTQTKSTVESQAEVTSTNPFDENFSSNPFDEIPNSPAANVSTVQQRSQSAVPLLEGKASADEKDLISAQREKRLAPQPPGKTQAERQSQREQDGNTRHLAQINKQSKDKDVKTVSVHPQRSVQMIAPLSRSPTDAKNTKIWATNDDPVERAESPGYEPYESGDEQSTPEPVISLFAIGKLSRYGFDRERSKQALESGGGEFGATLEQLLHQVFSERYGQKAVSPDGLEGVPMDECLSQRQEEALALTAIYGERFSERISNAVWTITLDLAFIAHNAARNDRQGGSRGGGGGVVNIRDVCRFYMKGQGCRFGDKCKFKHQLPTKGRSGAGSPDLTGPSQPGFSSFSPPEYELEIRFPKGNRYPFQAPIVAFSTTDESVGAAGRLSVTERLFGEALAAAKSSEPVVYTLITVCEDETTMNELLAVGHHKYSTPPPVVVIPPPSLAIAKSKSVRSNASEESRSSSTSSRRTAPPNNQRPTDLKETAEAEELDERDEEDEDQVVPVESESYVNLRKKMVNKHNLKIDNLLQENNKLCREFQRKQSSRRFESMLEQRRRLPAWQEKEKILDLLDQCQVLVVSGMTGCGKTTQIPQFILDASLGGRAKQVANIICTQPRRISAISVAQRVAQERAERLGNSVGYQIRLESVRSSATRLLYCTTGVLLRRLEGEADLKGVTHVIVDEVHERTEESDFLLLVLKDLLVQRPDLKIILMSATLNANLFSEYFYNCPTVHIPGRTFPVDQFFLEDAIAKSRYVIEDGSPYMRSGKQNSSFTSGQGSRGGPRDVVDDLGDDMWNFMSFCKKDFVKDSIPDQQLSLQELTVRYKDTKKSVLKTISAMDLDKINMDLVESLLEWIVDGKHDYPPGAVLVFLPGLAEIKMLYEQLKSNRMFNNRGATRCEVYPLHSTLTNDEQQAVFSRPPEGVTKIIISTNIAETSVTIDDVVYVIDSGKMKEKRYDASKSMESLEDSWVSRANALQRRGRAGRVASGVCFHLFTSHCFQHQLAEQQLPEIQRVPLEQLCLRIKILDVFAERALESVFSRLIEPPAMGSLDAAKQRLRDLGALTADEKLTPLGYHLACLPVDVRIGKLMLFGAIFRCLDPALTIAASLAFKSPFVSPWDKREEANEKKLAFAVANSDHLALLQAYKGWCCAAKNGNQAGFLYCRENFLSWRGLQEIASLKRQFAELLSDIGFIKEGLRARTIERMCSKGTDGILEATGHEANLNADNIRLMSAMLCAALYPNVVQVRAPQGNYKMTSKGAMKMQPKANELRFMTKNDGCVHVHPSSVNYTVRHYNSPYLVYHEKVKTSRVFIRDCSMVSVYPLVLFGGGQVNMELHKGEFVISLDDGWIRFAASSHQVAELVKELRWELDQLLEDKIRNPSMDLCSCPRGSRIIHMIVHLITTQ